jgi:hypothetical protein
MKRFLGWILAGAGGAGTLWAGYFLLTGSSAARMDPLPVTAMTGGLIGVALLTVGLVWARD